MATYTAPPAPSTPCVLWRGCLRPDGYGQVWHEGTVRKAHRVAWESVHGPIPPGLTVDHLCNVPRCVRVDHMELVTRAENNRRAAARREACRRGHKWSEQRPMSRGGRRACRVCYDAAARARRERYPERYRATRRAAHAARRDRALARG